MRDMEGFARSRLAFLQAQVWEWTDESHLHIGHAGHGGGGHYRLLLVSGAFAGVSRLARQRTVQQALADGFSAGHIHALSLRALTPEEYFSLNNPSDKEEH